MSRRSWIVLAVVLAIAVGLALAYRVALERLRAGVERALGPQASVGALHAGWAGIELIDVRIRAERKGRAPWPADDELRAARIVIVPEVASLWSDGWRVRSVTIDRGFVSLLRARDGRLRLLPSLLDKPRGGGSPATPVRIAHVRLHGGAVDLYDASVRQPPHRLRIERIEAELGPLALPGFAEPIALDVEGVL
jgi:hypothetical protein